MVAPVQHIRRLADPDFRMTEVARGRTGQGVIFTGDLFREKADVAVVRTEDQPFFSTVTKSLVTANAVEIPSDDTAE